MPPVLPRFSKIRPEEGWCFTIVARMRFDAVVIGGGLLLRRLFASPRHVRELELRRHGLADAEVYGTNGRTMAEIASVVKPLLDLASPTRSSLAACRRSRRSRGDSRSSHHRSSVAIFRS